MWSGSGYQREEPGLFTRYVAIPAGMVGVVIGKRGATIKTIQAMPLIRMANVKDDRLRISGDSDAAVAAAETEVKRIINNASMHASKAQGYLPKFSITCLEGVASSSSITFVQAHRDLYSFKVERRNAPIDEISQLGAQLRVHAVVSRPTTPKMTILASRDAELLRSTILSTMEGVLRGVSPPKKLKIKAVIAKIYFLKDSHSGQAIIVEDVPTTVDAIAPLAKNIKTQLAVNSEITEVHLDNLRGWLKSNGFERRWVRKSVVVHIVDLETKNQHVIKMRPDDDDANDKLAKEYASAVLSVLKSATFYEALGISKPPPSGSLAADVKKAFRKRAMEVHPDKNPHPGATLAFQLLNDARDKATRKEGTSPLIFPGESKEERAKLMASMSVVQALPKVHKYLSAPTREGFVSFVSPKDQGLRDRHDVRIDIRSSIPLPKMDDPTREALKRAWNERSPEGILIFKQGRLHVHAERHKETEKWTTDQISVKIYRSQMRLSGQSDSDDRIVKVSRWDLRSLCEEGTSDPRLVTDEMLALARNAKAVVDALHCINGK